MWSQLKSTRACPITESQFACLGYVSFLGLIGVLETQRVTHLDTPPPVPVIRMYSHQCQSTMISSD